MEAHTSRTSSSGREEAILEERRFGFRRSLGMLVFALPIDVEGLEPNNREVIISNSRL